MAREISRAQRIYAEGTHGPFAVDSFTRDTANALEVTMSVDGWPDISPLMSVELAWNTGGKAVFDVSGPQLDENGKPRAEVSFAFSIPKDRGLKRAATSATVTVKTFAPITTALSVRTI